MYKRIKILLTAVLMSMILILPLFTACNGKDNKDNTIIELSRGETISAYTAVDRKGISASILPMVRFACKRKIESLKLVGYEVNNVDGIECHSVGLECDSKKILSSFENYKGYNIYTCVFATEVNINGYNVGNEKLLISAIELEIDGEKYKFEQNYYLAIFEDEYAILDTYAGSAVGNKFDFLTTGLQAQKNIKITNVEFVSDAMSLDYGIKNGSVKIEAEQFMTFFPSDLEADVDYVFSFAASLKENVKAGSAYFIVTYTVDGSDKVHKSPFGFMALDYDWQKVADELLK